MRKSELERFWEKVDRSGGEDACWNWQACRHIQGYGLFRISRPYKVEKAHRYSYALTFGCIPDGLFVLHHCDNPPCVNPHHLFLGTQSDNMIDMTIKDRHNYKLTGDAIRKIRRLYAEGVIQRVIAKKFGISQTGVSCIVTNRIYDFVE